MLKRLSLIVLVLAGAACAPLSAPEGQLVPMKTIAGQIQTKPYECFEYDRATDSCAGLAKRSVRGNILTMDARVTEFVRGVGNMTMHIVVDFQMRETSNCGNFGNARVELSGGVIPSDIKEQAIASAKRNLARRGVVCYEYIRDAQGQYYNVGRDSTGRLTGSPDWVVFFATPKAVSS